MDLPKRATSITPLHFQFRKEDADNSFANFTLGISPLSKKTNERIMGSRLINFTHHILKLQSNEESLKSDTVADKSKVMGKSESLSTVYRLKIFYPDFYETQKLLVYHSVNETVALSFSKIWFPGKISVIAPVIKTKNSPRQIMFFIH